MVLQAILNLMSDLTGFDVVLGIIHFLLQNSVKMTIFSETCQVSAAFVYIIRLWLNPGLYKQGNLAETTAQQRE